MDSIIASSKDCYCGVNRRAGWGGIPAELFKILKHDAV